MPSSRLQCRHLSRPKIRKRLPTGSRRKAISSLPQEALERERRPDPTRRLPPRRWRRTLRSGHPICLAPRAAGLALRPQSEGRTESQERWTGKVKASRAHRGAWIPKGLSGARVLGHPFLTTEPYGSGNRHRSPRRFRPGLGFLSPGRWRARKTPCPPCGSVRPRFPGMSDSGMSDSGRPEIPSHPAEESTRLDSPWRDYRSPSTLPHRGGGHPSPQTPRLRYPARSRSYPNRSRQA
jgi:hypothetical protein